MILLAYADSAPSGRISYAVIAFQFAINSVKRVAFLRTAAAYDLLNKMCANW